MKKRCSKKGYFFLIDAVIALGVLAIGAFLIFSSGFREPFKDEPEFLSEDVMDFFANNQVKDVNNPYTGVGGTLWLQGNITKPENTLLQQVAELYRANEFENAENFVISLTQNSIPKQYEFEFWLDDYLVYPRNPTQAHIDSKARTAVLIPSKKLVHGIMNFDTGEMYGPYEAEVLVWQKG